MAHTDRSDRQDRLERAGRSRGRAERAMRRAQEHYASAFRELEDELDLQGEDRHVYASAYSNALSEDDEDTGWDHDPTDYPPYDGE